MSELQEDFQLDIGVEDFSFDPGNSDSFSLDMPDFREQEGLEYPALLLSNVLFMDCLTVLSKIKRPSFREVDTWVELEDGAGYQHIGSIQLDSTVLLTLRFLHIRATAYYSSESIQVLDLEDPTVLEQFI